MRSTARAAVFCAVASAAAASAQAQYFGRHSVQWERLRFEVLKTEHFDVHYYPEEKAAAEQVGRMAERWYARLSRILDYRFKDRQPLILYASHPHFQQTHTIGGAPGEGTGGVTEAFKRRIVLPMGASLAETDHVLGHELVHAFQFAMTGQTKSRAASALRMPLWFVEGMAEYLSVGPVDPHTSMWLRDAARRDKGLPTVRDLGSARYFPYRYGQALWAYIAGRFGDEAVARALRTVGPRSNDAEEVLQQALGIDAKTLSKDWHAAVREAYAPMAAGKQEPEHYGPALVTEKEQGGRLNLGPALSPDGSRLAFLSERDQLSVEMFVQDVRSGKVTRRLSQTLSDPHLESLQFISSAGAWDRSGRKVALGAVAKGRPVLLVVDADTGRRIHEVPLPGLGEAHTPTFSPDGRSVAFSALAGGFTDLFICELESGRLRRLTEDAFADLQPAWSPDGSAIAFVTDRFSTKLETLATGNYRLATVDVASGSVRPLASFPEGKNINPHWSPDGASLYFLSDRSGATNVYRLERATSTVFQVTDLAVGASGITALSPALTVATHSGRLAYSVYEEDRYEIHAIEDPERLGGWEVARMPDSPGGWEVARTASSEPGIIPGAKPGGAVAAARRDAQGGLPDEETFEKKPYKAKFGLDYVGQPTIGVGAGQFGTAYAGGISMRFSDMLGQHSLNVAVEAGNVSGFSDIATVLGYVNRERRFNWGVRAYQFPYVTGSFATAQAIIGGERVLLEQTRRFRELHRGASALGYYPLDASLRVEASVGLRSIGYETRIVTQGFAPGGTLVLDEEQRSTEPGAQLFDASVALVRDTTAFGPTGPILGQRFRFEVSPVAGTVDYAGVLADFRQYVMPVRPLTLAGRVLHYGRYGGGAQDPRLSVLFLGYPSLVRGYDIDSFSVDECGLESGGGCPVFDQLIGSRLLVGNLELRAPLLSLLGARRAYGAIPVEIGAFLDAGVAWYDGNRPALFGGDRQLVKSVGAVVRANLLGFAVLELDWVKPLDRPGKSAFFQFNLQAGF